MSEPFCLVIPAYNEAATIKTVIHQALTYVSTVIVVNDASDDATANMVRQTPAVLLEHPENAGKARALQTGFQYALAKGFERVITLDGDGQHDPASIPLLNQAFDRFPEHFVIAARLTNRENAPRARQIANKIADFWVGWAAGTPIADSQSGFRLYPASLLRQLDLDRHGPSGFVFESEVLIHAAQKGYDLVFVPIASCYPEVRRASHFRPGFDISHITLMVAGKLIRKGLFLPGLVKSVLRHPRIYTPKPSSSGHRLP
ncbi:MAG: glycosyltransferase family 2 protein [Hydrogenovibrio sp.]|uniref:glycosyltransferase family 2 protein n=1 Tax=Hydrogenovibrio sp. TaxID=2065821 RepID=UPI0028708FA8|nr:glycosyltransferase family 2 protein [Hydrogenovibrio sp.]MDR9499679.1 glycosyltransferase family 2 protein [Hydrogenovibrio sp.]